MIARTRSQRPGAELRQPQSRRRAAASSETPPHLRDLDRLSSPKGQQVAKRLGPLLTECRYHHFVLGKVAHESPFEPLSYEVGRKFIEEIGRDEEAGRLSTPPQLWMPWLFFHMGMPLNPHGIDVVFSGANRRLLDDAIDVGLIIPWDGENIRMNGLGIAARAVGDGEDDFYYYAADWAPNFMGRIYRQRVYAAMDSLLLLNKLQSLPQVSGLIAEGGLGSGIQTLGLLKMHAGIEHAYGLEIDARSRHVAGFNAHLNNLAGRLTVVESPEEFRRQLGSRQLSLVVSNPPFIALPDSVPIEEDDVPLLPKYAELIPGHPLRRVKLQMLYGLMGWGGPDGLAVTRSFFQEFLPALTVGGQMILYGQFVGDRRGPTNVMRLLSAFGYPHAQFEALMPELLSGTPEEHAIVTRATLETINHKLAGSNFGARFAAAVRDSFTEQGIEMVHGGYLTIQKK